MQISNIDSGKSFDWGNTSKDYAKYRDIYPKEFYQYILDLGLCKDGQKILDIGTGTGVLPRNIDFYTCPAEKIDYPDNTFDVITICQCIWYLDAAAITEKFAKILKEQGKILILYMGWLPYEDPIAGRSEEIILKYNPVWNAYGDTVHPVYVPDEFLTHFDIIKREEFRVDIPFTREGWHGRMRACRGVGASMNEEELKGWDNEHMQMLMDTAPEEFTLKHYVSIAELQVKKDIIN